MSERRFFARAIATALFAISIASSLDAAARPTRECPIEIASNKPWVRVAINNSSPQWFILDSGASGGTILAREAADRLGLERGSEIDAHIGAGAGVNVGMAATYRLEVKRGKTKLNVELRTRRLV